MTECKQYSPDIQAQGDCRNCGRTYQAHQEPAAPQEVELKPVEPEVFYDLAAMMFEVDSPCFTSFEGVWFSWGYTPEGESYWAEQRHNPTAEGHDKIRAMREQFERENA